MLDANCANAVGVPPSGVGVIPDSPHASDASGEALGPEEVTPGAATDLDLPVDDTLTRVLGPLNSVSDIVALATSHLRSPHSKRAYRLAVLEFMAWYECTGSTALNRGAVLGYVAELNRLRMSPATINVALCAIRRLASELTDNGLISNENASAIMRIKGPRRRGVRLGNWLNAAEAERLVSCAGHEYPQREAGPGGPRRPAGRRSAQERGSPTECGTPAKAGRSLGHCRSGGEAGSDPLSSDSRLDETRY